METIPIQGQTVCLVCNDLAGGEWSSKGQAPLGIVSCRTAGRYFFQQAFSSPPDWNGLLEEALAEKIPERHLLEVLARIDHVTGFTRHFGPLSGSEPKTADARERHLLTIFAYGTHLGPHQMARHLKGVLTADQIAHLNHRHFTVTNLEAALRDIIDRFHRFTLPRYWGDEKRVAADGTQYDLAEENLLAERHIRYGGFGGIAYHHVSDLYILLIC